MRRAIVVIALAAVPVSADEVILKGGGRFSGEIVEQTEDSIVVDIGGGYLEAPMDKVVSELMIYVNSEWGRAMAEAGVAAIYRAQGNGKVRMSTVPAPHQGLGVAYYTWSSSPLRR